MVIKGSDPGGNVLALYDYSGAKIDLSIIGFNLKTREATFIPTNENGMAVCTAPINDPRRKILKSKIKIPNSYIDYSPEYKETIGKNMHVKKFLNLCMKAKKGNKMAKNLVKIMLRDV